MKHQAELREAPPELAVLEARINLLLPPQYQLSAGQPSPRSMGSASLKYGPDGRAAWDQVWTSFCDLALAGGPPHRATLLEAPTPDEVSAEPAGYQLVSEEVARGIRMTTGLPAVPGSAPGWVDVPCRDEGMASWLLRAVLAENVHVRQAGSLISAPAGPAFRLAKEVKNVIVSLAKTCHYWDGHLSQEQRQAAGVALQAAASSLLVPVARPDILPRAEEFRQAAERTASDIREATGLAASSASVLGWVGVRFGDEMTAAWYVRAAIAADILARREEEVLYLPVTVGSTGGQTLTERLALLQRAWAYMRQAA
jgi:hypothetical protein